MRRVLVLGGGCGGVAAAWALSRTPELRGRFRVTLVQAGWRLGGKGATGRDPHRGQRILEHGLHLWLGWYRTAFRFLADVYADDAHVAPRGGLLRGMDTAFSPLHDVVLAGGDDARPDLWRLSLPPAPGRPWDADALPLDWPAVLTAWARRLPAALAPIPGDPGWSAARVALVAGLVAAVARGCAREVVGRPDPWERLDAEDLRAWLRRHGATPAQADLPLVRALYDLGFAYPDGVPGAGRGEMAAGAGLKALLQIVAGYRGAPFWRMNAGMGDTVFAPAYRVLQARGVDFRFFHRLDRLGVGAAGDSVDTVEIGVQADAPGYDPLVRVGSVEAWPDRPRFDRLRAMADGDPEADVGPALRTATLRRGEDYDDIVLAIPATGHARFAAALMDASPRYRAMVENTFAVPTVAAQLWLARSAGELGWTGTPPVCTGLPGLFRTWADMSEVTTAEAWEEPPAGVAYLCNVAPPELFGTTDRAAASAWVADRLRAEAGVSLGRVWPHARVGRTLDDAVLHAPADVDPWRWQYARANVAAWERYVLTRPGSTKHRLAPGESGFTNVVLAGDWTKNIVNGGSVEGAVASGVEAAEVLVGR